MRKAGLSRTTGETRIDLSLSLDDASIASIRTGIPFFDHMLHAMVKHGRFGLMVEAEGDLDVDAHHTIEDVGIVLGEVIRQLIGGGHGIHRFGHAIVPMDESIATVAIDCGGRAYLTYHVPFTGLSVGTIEVEIFEHFFYSLSNHAKITTYIKADGRNDHHLCEAVFKAFGIALSDAVAITGDPGAVPSTKGTL